MNTSQALQTAGRVGSFCGRHLLALLVTVVVLCVFWTVTYFALLLWAGFAGGGLGSPAAYPLGLLVVLAVATAVAVSLYLPSTAFAEWFAKRQGFPALAQIPLSVAVFALLCLAIAGFAAALGDQPSVRGVSSKLGLLFLVNLVPLGLYWWVAQSVPLLLSLSRRLRSVFRSLRSR